MNRFRCRLWLVVIGEYWVVSLCINRLILKLLISGCRLLVFSCDMFSRLFSSFLVVCSEVLMCLVRWCCFLLFWWLLCSVEVNSCVVLSGCSMLWLIVVRKWVLDCCVILVLCECLVMCCFSVLLVFSRVFLVCL